MSKKQLIELSRQAIAEFSELPSGVQIQLLVDNGTINSRGEVLLGQPSQGSETQDAQVPAETDQQ